MRKNNVIIAGLMMLVVLSGSLAAGNGGKNPQKGYDRLWNTFAGCLEKDLPESAAKTLDEIESKALKENNQTQLLKSWKAHGILYSFSTDDVWQQNYIRYLEARTGRLDTLYEAVLQMTLAEAYASLLFTYEWIIDKNMPVDGDISETDMIYWDKGSFISRINAHFAEAMKPVGALKRAMTADYLISFKKSSTDEMPDLTYEKTMFEYILHRVANCYSGMIYIYDDDMEAGLDDEAWWLPAEDFVKIDLDGNADNPLIKCLKIYQELIAYSLKNENVEALIYNDIRRFDVVNILSPDYEKAQKALSDLRIRHAGHPLSAEIAALMAKEMVQKQNDSYVKDSTYYFNYRDAKTLCEEAIAQFPKSEGAEKCRKIIVGIERQRIEISMNEVQLPGEPIPAVLEYLNVPTFCYRIVKVSEKEFERFEEWAWKNPKGYEKRLRKIASKKAFIEQEVSLPAETDYCTHTTMIALPALECGHYYLLGRAGKGNKNAVLFDFQVSELAYVADYKNDSSMTVAIMNRRTGLPEAGVTVECYRRIWDYKSDMYKTVPIGTFLSDSQGLVILDGKRCPGNFQFNLRRGNDILLSSDGDFHLAGTYDLLEDEVIEVEEEVVEYEEEADIRDGHIHTTLLTDRAIYRPGQTVYFQGVVTRSTGDKEILMAGYSEKVSLKANWRAIDSAEFVTDEYGSFSGSFVIPTGMGNCRFQLHTGHGFDDVRVEEYKRPTFEVTFNKPDGQYKINEEVTLHGDVKAFAGFGLDDVEYNYRVVRKTSFPWRCGWNWYPEGISDKQIAQGKSRTDENGKFAITFNLKPSQDIAPERQPLFTYEIEVTATSRQGEPHIGRYSIRVGYNEVALSCDLPSEVEQNDIGKYRISADNPDGRPVKSRVSRRIYRYDTPTKCSYFTELRNSRLLRYPAILDRQLLSDAELDSLFPVFTFYEKQNKTLVYEDELLVDGTAPLSAGKKLEAGKYMLELMSPDDSLSVITKDFVVYENDSHKMPYPVMQWVKSDQDSVHPGEELSFRIGSCATGAVVWLQLVHGNEIRMEKWIRLDNEVQFFTYRVTEQDRGGLSLKTALVKENMTPCYKKEIVVPYDNYNLDVSLATVRDQLTPGAEEKWEVTVRDYKDKPLEASLLSGMYDASLERFTAHRWNFDLKPQNVVSKKFFKDGFEFLEHSDVEYFYDFYYLDIFRFNLPSNNPLMAYWEEGVSPAISGDMSFLPPPPSAEMSLGCCEMHECAEVVEREASAGCFRFDFEDSDDGQDDSGQPAEPTLRENFNETAFFFPQLRTNADGSATFSFTMPDALTRWKLMLLAYTKERQTGYKEYTFTSSKPVMIMADMPRYIYDNDTIWMVANVINTGEEAVTPKAKLDIFDAATMQPLNLLLSDAEIPMETILPGRSHEVRWKVAAKHDLGLIAFRFTAYAGTFSDAEQRLLPVLCSEVFMTQTLPFTVKANREQTFNFDAIANPGSNERDHSLTLNFSSNPVWYAVQSLPYLANTKTDNAENAFYVFYANTLASHIAGKIPNLLNYIRKWQIETPEALQSQLEKDQDLKAIMLQETPWVLEAKSESEQRSRLAALFEVNTLRNRQG
ncbi:MAG: hypothetical protein IKP89_08615, partial [Bacteroidales bacterium]|nr:hypothetical protein [Bacteroidales bacterium]